MVYSIISNGHWEIQMFIVVDLSQKLPNFTYIVYIPIGQRPIALLDSSKSINIKSISTGATIYLMSTALQNCKINCLYSVLPGKLEVIMLIALIIDIKAMLYSTVTI